jgi:hypothetical protein
MYFPGKIGHFLIIMHIKYVSLDGIPQTFVFFRFVDIIDITVHDRFLECRPSKLYFKIL